MKGDKQSNIGNSSRLLGYATFPGHWIAILPVQMKILDGLCLIHDLCSLAFCANPNKIVRVT
jgi:hypothetical protein